MNIHPAQLLLDGRTHAEAIASPRPARLTPGRSAVLDALGAAGRPLTLAELTAALHGEPDPRGWVHGEYPTTWLARVAGIVRRMETAGLVDVAWGPLSHRRQVGVVVSRVGGA